MTTTPHDKIRQRVMEHVDFELAWLDNLSQCDSPIETILLLALRAISQYDNAYEIDVRPAKLTLKSRMGSGKHLLIFARQSQIESYRVDFEITLYPYGVDENTRHLVVECDGHDYHERTKEQAASDRSRDRRLQELGYTVFRFTGSEIWRDPCKCADQILRWASQDHE